MASRQPLKQNIDRAFGLTLNGSVIDKRRTVTRTIRHAI